MRDSITKSIPQFVPYWDDEERKAVQDVLNCDYLNEHKKTREFENKFAEFVGAKYCITCTSGTIALYLALKSAEGQLEEDIVVPDYNGIFVSNATVQAGFKPSIQDVGGNGCFQKYWDNSFVVHANGRLGKTKYLEDCCQAVQHHTKGAISCYSFASTKHITTGGQGGAVCCDDKEVFDSLTRLKDHGRTDRQNLMPVQDNFEHWGTNFKFTEIQAAFGIVQLKKLPRRLQRLSEIYKMYSEELFSLTNIKFFEERPRWYIDALVDDVDSLIVHLKSHGISSKRFAKPLHTQPLYRINNEKQFRITNNFYERGIMLPSTTNLSDGEIHYIVSKIKDFYVVR